MEWRSYGAVDRRGDGAWARGWRSSCQSWSHRCGIGGDRLRLDRKSVVWGKSVDLGGRRIFKRRMVWMGETDAPSELNGVALLWTCPTVGATAGERGVTCVPVR